MVASEVTEFQGNLSIAKVASSNAPTVRCISLMNKLTPSRMVAIAAAAGMATSAYAACLTVSDAIAADVLSIHDLAAEILSSAMCCN